VIETDQGGQYPLGGEPPRPRSDKPADDYCVDCGHDHHPNHRGGRCWTDVLGNAIERTTTKIACTCKQFQSAAKS